MTKKFIAIQNIPTPYRIAFFNELAKQLSVIDLELKVKFMGKKNSNRPSEWFEHLENFALFDYEICSGYCFEINNGYYWLNPKLIYETIIDKDSIIFLGGAWDSITNLFIALFGKFNKKLLWIELNDKILGNKNFIITSFKRFLLNRFSKVFVPGQAGNTCLDIYKISGNKRGILPNLIDEQKFKVEHGRNVFRKDIFPATINDNDRVMLCPARLEKVKGIYQFLSIIEPELLTGWKLVFLGSGSERQKILKLIEERKISENIIIITDLPYASMPDAYASSDCFLLPSISDPNPLTVIEALHSGLPLMLSDRVGNFNEALKENQNGFAFNIFDKESVNEAFKKLNELSVYELEKFSQKSKLLSEDWQLEKVVQKFIKQIFFFGE